MRMHILRRILVAILTVLIGQGVVLACLEVSCRESAVGSVLTVLAGVALMVFLLAVNVQLWRD